MHLSRVMKVDKCIYNTGTTRGKEEQQSDHS